MPVYPYDPHLTPLLEACSREELEPLVQFLATGPTSTLRRHPDVQRHWPAHERYLHAIVHEIHLFGGHSLKDRLSRGDGGQPYIQIVRRLLKQLGQTSFIWDIASMERRVAELTLDVSFDELPPEDQARLRADLYAGKLFEGGLRSYTVLDKVVDRLHDQGPQLDAQRLKKVAASEAKDLARGTLSKAALKLVARGLAGPVGWGMSAWSWLGPADRVTIPVIWYVAYLRARKPGPAP